MPTMSFSVETDANGFFQKTEIFDSPIPWDTTVDLRAKLKAPADTCIVGSVDVDAADGTVLNQEKNFRVCHGERLKLGQWRIDKRENVVVVRGKTIPARPRTKVTVEIKTG